LDLVSLRKLTTFKLIAGLGKNALPADLSIGTKFANNYTEFYNAGVSQRFASSYKSKHNDAIVIRIV